MESLVHNVGSWMNVRKNATEVFLKQLFQLFHATKQSRVQVTTQKPHKFFNRSTVQYLFFGLLTH